MVYMPQLPHCRTQQQCPVGAAFLYCSSLQLSWEIQLYYSRIKALLPYWELILQIWGAGCKRWAPEGYGSGSIMWWIEWAATGSDCLKTEWAERPCFHDQALLLYSVYLALKLESSSSFVPPQVKSLALAHRVLFFWIHSSVLWETGAMVCFIFMQTKTVHLSSWLGNSTSKYVMRTTENILQLTSKSRSKYLIEEEAVPRE